MVIRRTVLITSLTAILLFDTALCLAADPTLHEVYQTAETGNTQAALGMMDQVLRDHPNSAKAHFVEAELLAKQGSVERARGELATAAKLDPGLTFAKPGAAQELEARLSASSRAGGGFNGYVHQQAAPSFPWGTLLVSILFFAAVIFFIRRRQTQPVLYPAGGPYGVGPTGAAYGPAYGPTMGPSPNGIGGGILGGLATGAALGAGMVAGEALMHRAFGGGSAAADPYIPIDAGAVGSQQSYDMGGNDFGVDDSGSWDDGSSSGGGDGW